MSHLIVDLDVTDPAYAANLVAAGLPAWRSLSAGQRDGWRCLDCDREADAMRPVGFCPVGQVFVCEGCYEALS